MIWYSLLLDGVAKRECVRTVVLTADDQSKLELVKQDPVHWKIRAEYGGPPRIAEHAELAYKRAVEKTREMDRRAARRRKRKEDVFDFVKCLCGGIPPFLLYSFRIARVACRESAQGLWERIKAKGFCCCCVK